ncbi:MAG: hypothetical protein CVU22_03245 [Betaproteobacteria bacterium HGW-Betaproteobacteria-16]|nr:MAG: hypothetical protein CVU22_03245 [Betaproteobacteria bacterium HGW-Betaproteobacteria-16]
MKPQWTLVANGSQARIFSRASLADPLVALATIDFPEGRQKGRDLERDRQGHESSDHSSAATHFEPHTPLRKKLLHQFAMELTQRLEAGLADGTYGSLWIIASSELLGELKDVLSEGVVSHLQKAHAADFTGLDIGEIESRLRGMHP